jgi:hypothetical protein
VERDLDRTIERAGRLLKEIIMAYCERTYLFKIVAVEKTNTRLILSTGPAQMGRFYQFPRHLFDSEGDIEMALTANRCTEALGCFADLVRQILEGTRCAVSEVVIVEKEPGIQAAFSGQVEIALEDTYHNIFVVTSPDGQKNWALDPTGAQFGTRAPVMGYHTYLEAYAKRLEGTYEFGTCKGAMESCKMTTMSLNAVQPAYNAVEQWVEGTGMSLPELLRETGHIFEEGREILVDIIKYELDAAMAGADYTAEFGAAFS